VAAVCNSANKTERYEALDAARKRTIHVLLCTDLAARGLHIGGLTHVVNFDAPQDWVTYLHRAGRVGRLGAYRHGTVVTLVGAGPHLALEDADTAPKPLPPTEAENEAAMGAGEGDTAVADSGHSEEEAAVMEEEKERERRADSKEAEEEQPQAAQMMGKHARKRFLKARVGSDLAMLRKQTSKLFLELRAVRYLEGSGRVQIGHYTKGARPPLEWQDRFVDEEERQVLVTQQDKARASKARFETRLANGEVEAPNNAADAEELSYDHQQDAWRGLNLKEEQL
jgi:superfamily II DNA/RNA helicase